MTLSQVNGQSIARQWTAPYPKGATSITYSHDALLYAYLVNDSTIVRGNGLTGGILDTLRVPQCQGITYHGSRLYIMKTGGVRLDYIGATSDTVVRTKATFGDMNNGSSSDRFSKFKVLSIAGDPRVIVFANVVSWNGSAQSTGGVTRFIDTATHTVAEGGFGANDGFGIAADGQSVAASSSCTFYRNPYSSSSSSCTYYDVPIGYSPRYFISRSEGSGGSERNDVLPGSLLNPMPIGVRGVVHMDGGLYDMRSHRVLSTTATQPKMLCNLGSRGLMMGMKSDVERRVLGSYDLVTQVWIPFDTLAPSLSPFSTPTVYSSINVAFVYDTVTSAIMRYSLPTRSVSDTAVLRREKDTVTLFKTVRHSVDVFCDCEGVSYRWYVNGPSIARTTTPYFDYVASNVGWYSFTVEVLDSNEAVIFSASNVDGLIVQRPPLPTMVFRASNHAILSLDLSLNGKRLAVSTDTLLSIYDLPSAPADGAALRTLSRKGPGSLGFVGGADSLLWLMPKGDSYNGYYNYWYRSNATADTLIMLQNKRRNGMYGNNGQRIDYYSMTTSGRILYNPLFGWWYTLSWVTTTWGPGLRSDFVARVPVYPLDTTQYDSTVHAGDPYIIEKQTVHNADASYDSTVIVCGWQAVRFINLLTCKQVDSIVVSWKKPIKSAIQLDATTLATTLGTYTRAESWQPNHTFDFSDGELVVRLPTADYFVIIRADADSIGHIVSSTSGEVVYTFGQGFGIPRCAVYDAADRVIHIGDNSGIVSTWAIPAEFTTGVEEGGAVAGLHDVRIVPNPAEDAFAIEGLSTTLPDATLITLATLTGQGLPLVPVGVGRYSLSGVATGVYLVSVRYGNQLHTHLLVKR